MSHTNAQSRLNYMQQSPELVKKLQDFSMAIVNSGHIELGLSHLVDIRASQMNGCAFCLDMHVKEAKLHGERELRLYHVAIWRESPLFTPKERAAQEPRGRRAREPRSERLGRGARRHAVRPS